MPDLGLLEQFHFLRPLWLVSIAPALILWLLIRRRTSADRRWRTMIAPHLLDHLKVGKGARRRFQPIHLVVLFVVIGALGAAGPTWEKEVSPFAQDTAPLVVALDLSETMNAVDISPTRLERAKLKLQALLKLRAGARNALIVYTGSAHTVLPLCDDPKVFDIFIEALTTDIMPRPGKSPDAALALAGEMLADEEVPGSVLFITDGIAASHAPVFASFARQSKDAVLVLAVGTKDGGPIRNADGRYATGSDGRRVVATLDIEGFETLADETGAFVVGMTSDDADIRRLQRRVRSHLRSAEQDDDTSRWQDAGYYLVFPGLLLCWFWFRRGWTVRWSAALLAGLMLSGCAPGDSGGWFVDLWLTADQQGQRLYERGDYALAAERFADPFWKGVALYRAGEFEGALDRFTRVNSAEAEYNLGNAYAQLTLYNEALASYDAALAARPEWDAALMNRDLIDSLMASQQTEADDPPPGGDAHFEPDEIQFDEKGKQGQSAEIEMEQLTNQQLSEMWLRRLQTSPAGFLRWRFAMESMAPADRGDGR